MGVLSYSGDPLDQDIANPVTSYSFTVTATSSGRSITKDAVLNVKTLDDNSPVFVSEHDYTSDTYNLLINENLSSKVFLEDFSATDADATNNTITYSISGLTGLSIGSTTGVVSYSGDPLDQDIANPVTSYSFTVTATSNGKSTTKDALLYVTAVDDSPAFASSILSTLSIDEDDTNKYFGDFVATDSDNDDREITYSLSSDAPTGLIINNSSGYLIYIGSGLDVDAAGTVSSYNFEVIATSGSRITRHSVTLNVNNVDDNNPEFEQDIYNFSIDENQDGTINAVAVGTVTAEDVDLVGNIVYSIDDTNSVPFEIDSSTGVVSYNSNLLDYESSVSYSFTVKAIDNGIGNASAVSATVNVTITDVNEAPTVITPIANQSVKILTTKTISLSNVFSDVDDGDTLSYSFIVYKNEIELTNTSWVTITNSDLIINTGTLSFSDAGDDYRIEVIATDSGGVENNQLNVTNSFNLNLTNGIPPVITGSPYSFTLEENDTSETFGTITATDSDDDDSAITFSLVPVGTTAVPDGFRITASGVFSYNGAGVNRESLPEDGIITVRVQALSDSLATTADIKVMVNDADEFNPMFTNINDFTISANSLSIDETAVSKTFTEDFSATDEDSDDSTITYSISGLTGLSISSTGVVSYSGSALDQDGSNPVTSYNITVTATSNGKSATKDAVLNINAVDEFSPVFTDTRDLTIAPGNLSIDEDKYIKVFSADLTATDADFTNNTIVYDLYSTLTGLSISSTGVVSYNGDPLDQDIANPVTSYSFTVTATSNGVSTTKEAALKVNAVDDNSPIFNISTNYTLSANRLNIDETEISKTFTEDFSATESN